MKEAKPFVQGYVYAQRVECEEPCEGRLSRTVLGEGEGETPSLYSAYDSMIPDSLRWGGYQNLSL